MIRHGTKPTIHWSGNDFHKSFGTVGIDTSTLPQELHLDAGLWMPDQEIPQTFGSFSVPALPFGCTDYGGTDACMDEDGIQENPMLLETADEANALGGISITTMLAAAMKVFDRTAYFSIRAQAPLDWFDAIRVCLASTETEKRIAIVGTPYYDEWADTSSTGIMPTPASFSPLGLPWHCYVICGWTTINGEPMLIAKTWQGTRWGDQGWGYMSRALVNNVMNVGGSVAYTLTKDTPSTVIPIDWNFVEWIQSLFNYLIV